MAAVVCNADFDLGVFDRHIAARLPAYARPVFVRILREIEMTATFKQKKQDLMRAGYAPVATTDLIYVKDRDRDEFVNLDSALFERVQTGTLRL